VRPHNTEQVAEILEWANETKTPVVPYGGGSGVVESIVGDGVVVVELRAMNEVVEFDEKSRLVTTQAGVMGSDLSSALSSWGYTLGHEPQSMEISTVGGWVATKACGQLSTGYGGIETMVAGLEAVLPGGRVIRSKANPRRAAGPELATLMIGSEGTLGIVTEVTLRAVPLPTERADRCVRFDHMADGVAACRTLAQSELRPTVVRLYDHDDSAIFLRNSPGAELGPLLLLSFEGEGAEARASLAVDLSGGRPGDDALVAHWWSHRNDIVDEYAKLMGGEGVLGPHAMVESMEVAGTWSCLRDVYHSMREALLKEADLVGCHLSHVYPDGACLYFDIASACEDDAQASAKLDRWWEAGMEACLAAGGSVSHHHGIGRRRVPWLDRELGGWLDVLAAVKAAVDPNRIMNPGALGL
jgi:alkyldihydroxyacetonephosphate synthase